MYKYITLPVSNTNDIKCVLKQSKKEFDDTPLTLLTYTAF